MITSEEFRMADIKILKDDPIDSVWIEIASDQYEFGWIHESELLKSVVPDDPISQFILTFSDVHLLIFLIIISLIAGGYVVYRLQRRKVKVVHFDDIDSFYPTLLAITVAAAATFYSSIQLFAPDTWHYFYFHPTLNPFALSPILAVFLISVWSMMIILIATIDDVYHKLSPTAARSMPGYARNSIRRRSACGSRTTLMRIPTPALLPGTMVNPAP
jgi:hypothetical protein